MVNIEDSFWREALRTELLSKTILSGKHSKLKDLHNVKDAFEQEGDHFHVLLKEPEIKKTARAAPVTENLLDFAYFMGNEELPQAVVRVNDILT